MSRNIDIDAKCPFYVEEAGIGHRSQRARMASEILRKKRIRCEGLTQTGKILLEFSSAKEKDAYVTDFCYSMCYKGCPVAQMLLEQHGAIRCERKER